jgi:hypothetical protein
VQGDLLSAIGGPMCIYSPIFGEATWFAQAMVYASDLDGNGCMNAHSNPSHNYLIYSPRL